MKTKIASHIEQTINDFTSKIESLEDQITRLREARATFLEIHGLEGHEEEVPAETADDETPSPRKARAAKSETRMTLDWFKQELAGFTDIITAEIASGATGLDAKTACTKLSLLAKAGQITRCGRGEYKFTQTNS